MRIEHYQFLNLHNTPPKFRKKIEKKIKTTHTQKNKNAQQQITYIISAQK